MASPKLPEKVWRHREQNPGAGFRQSSNPEGKCESLIKFNGEIAGGSDSGIHHFSIYLPARTPASGRGSLDMQPEKVTHLGTASCRRGTLRLARAFSPRTNLRAPGFFPGQGQIGRFQWIIGLIPQVPGAVRQGSCIIRSDCSADILQAFLAVVSIKFCFAFSASESSSTIVIERARLFSSSPRAQGVASRLERVGGGVES